MSDFVNRNSLGSVQAADVAVQAQRLGRFLQDHHARNRSESLLALALTLVVAAEQDALDLSQMVDQAKRIRDRISHYAPEHARALRDFARWYIRQEDEG